MKNLNFALCIIFLFTLLSCSKSEKDIDVKKGLETQIKNESKGMLTLEDLKIEEAKLAAVNGKVVYVVNYIATVKANEDCHFGKSRENPLSRYIALTKQNVKDHFGDIVFLMTYGSVINGDSIQKDEKKDIGYELIFWKVDESNWQDQFGNLY